MSARVAYLIIGMTFGLIMLNVIGSAVAYSTMQRDVDIVQRLSGEPKKPRIYMPAPVIIKSGHRAEVYFEDEIPPTMRSSMVAPRPHAGRHGKNKKRAHHGHNNQPHAKVTTQNVRSISASKRAKNEGNTKNETENTEPFFTKNM